MLTHVKLSNARCIY